MSSSSTATQVIPDAQWEQMKIMISDQLDNVTSSLDELRQNGSLETIAQMIKRGDSSPSARLQAWYHAMLEVEYCNRPYSSLQKLQFMYNTHKAKGPDDTPQSFILDTSLTAQASGNEEWKRRSGRPLECPESVVSRLEGKRKLSVAERNELWLAKKKVKVLKVQSLAEEKQMQERAKSAPDLSRSRQSFTSLATSLTQESDGPADVVAVAQKRTSRIVTKRSITTADPRRSSVARKRSIATADPNRSSSTVASRRSIMSAGQRRPSKPATRKRSITTADPNANPRSLGNITNHTEVKRRKKQKIGPISDPFTRKEMVR